MYNIVICDDNSEFIEFMKEIIINCGIDKNNIDFYEYLSGEEFIASIKKIQYCDLLILDMRMREMDGHATAKAFRKIFPDVILVFCSGARRPTDETFKTTPFRYLLKNYSDAQMLEEMKTVMKEVENHRVEHFIIGNYYYSTVRLKPDDIIYIENMKRGSILHVRKDKIEYSFEENITTKQKLVDLYPILKYYGFEYAHNSYLVNLKYVIKIISKGEIKLIEGTVLTVSRSKLKEFRMALSNELSRKYNI